MLEKEIDSFFFENYSESEKLTSEELSEVPKEKLYGIPSILSGWKFKHNDEIFYIILGEDYPYSMPVIFFKNIGLFDYSHVEKEGRVCWIDDSEQYDHVYKAHFLKQSIEKAKQLIDTSGPWNEEAFKNEILSYWDWASNQNKKAVFILDNLVGTYKGKALYKNIGKNGNAVIATDELKIKSFFSDLKSEIKSTFKEIPIIEFSQAFTPQEFPVNSKDLYSLIDKYAVDRTLATCLVDNSFLKKDGKFLVLINIRNRIHLAVWVNKFSIPKNMNGFRKEMKPNIYLKLAHQIGVSLELSNVNYADYEWMYERGSSGLNKVISSKSVLIIGCGSLSSGVIKLLIQSGVKNINLIDPDCFKTDNLMRHELPINYSNFNKAEAIEHYMKKKYAGILNIKGHSTSFEKYYSDNKSFFSDFDLILELTGNRTVMSLLNSLQLRNDFPPILYSWVEPYSIAGHIIIDVGLGGCIECGFCEGKFRFTLIDWKKDPRTFLGGCGVVYQSYGMSSMSPVQSMITRMAINVLEEKINKSIHCTWIGDMSTLNELQGELNKEAAKYYNYNGSSHYEVVKDWRQNEKCNC